MMRRKYSSLEFLCILNLLAATRIARVDGLQPRNLPCDFLPDNPTWNDLRDALDQSGGFAYLCPFRIEGAGCPQSDDVNRRYIVKQSIDQSLVCDLTAGVESECVINCPFVSFLVKGSFTVESIIFRNYSAPVVVVDPNATSTTKASKFENGAQGAIDGKSESNIKIIQGTIVSGNNMDNFEKGVGVSTQGDLEIDGSTFADNVNNVNSGGAVYAGPNGKVIVTGSTFRSNRAEYGPAVFTEAPLSNVTIENNRACNNIGSLGDASSCDGVYLFSSLTCIPFQTECTDQNPEPTQSPMDSPGGSNCIFIACIWEWLWEFLVSLIFGGANNITTSQSPSTATVNTTSQSPSTAPVDPPA